MQNFNILAYLSSWAGWIECNIDAKYDDILYLVRNSMQ